MKKHNTIKQRNAIIPIVLGNEDIDLLKQGNVLEYQMGKNVKIQVSYK